MSTEPIFELLTRAIDVAALRQSVHASNIANADVTGYRRLEVSFEKALDAATTAQAAAAPDVAAGRAEEQGTARIVASADETVRLDQEMAEMARNSVRYQALVTAFEKTIGLLRLAVRDGREG